VGSVFQWFVPCVVPDHSPLLQKVGYCNCECEILVYRLLFHCLIILCVCVCVWCERERERERDGLSVHILISGWLKGVPGEPTRAYCSFCKKSLHAHRLSLLKHTSTLKHTRAAQKNFAQKVVYFL
jgi:hypothetical protein